MWKYAVSLLVCVSFVTISNANQCINTLDYFLKRGSFNFQGPLLGEHYYASMCKQIKTSLEHDYESQDCYGGLYDNPWWQLRSFNPTCTPAVGAQAVTGGISPGYHWNTPDGWDNYCDCYLPEDDHGDGGH